MTRNATTNANSDPANLDPELLERFVEVGLERLEREQAMSGLRAEPRRPRDTWRWLAAAILILGLGVVWTVQDLRHSPKPQDGGLSAGQKIGEATGEAAFRTQDPEPAAVRSHEDAKRLPPDTKAIRLFEADVELLSALLRFRELQRLEVVWPRIAAEDLCAQLAKFSSLQGLHIETPMRGIVLGELVRLPTLLRLSLHAIELDGDRIRELARCPALRELDLRACRGLTPEDLEGFEDLTSLRWLGLTPSHHLAISDLNGMPAPERFETLVLGMRSPLYQEKGVVIGIEDVTHAQSEFGLQGLTKFRNLRTLSLRASREMPGSEVRHLRGLKKLEALDLSGCFKVTGNDLQLLPASLKRLDLSSTRWDAPLPATLVHLECLTARRTWKLTDDALAESIGLPRFRSLQLRHCAALTAKAIDALTGRPWVELDLGGQPWLGDDELAPIAKIRTLERLCISGTRDIARLSLGDGGPSLVGGKSPITGKGIRSLNQLSNLSWLEMEDLQPVTLDDLRSLRELPLKVLSIGGTDLHGPDGQPILDRPAALESAFESCDLRERPESFSLGPIPKTWDTAWADRVTKRRS